MNKSGIEPTEYKVVVKPIKVEEKTKGGIIIPEETKDRMQGAAVEGEIIAISPLAFNYDEGLPDAAKPKLGDRVITAKYAGVMFTGKDGVEYRIINDRDVVAVLT